MPIRLQGLTSGFDERFLGQSPLVERAVAERGVAERGVGPPSIRHRKKMRKSITLAISAFHHDDTVSARSVNGRFWALRPGRVPPRHPSRRKSFTPA